MPPTTTRRGRRPNAERQARPYTIEQRQQAWYIRASVPGLASGTRRRILDPQGRPVRNAVGAAANGAVAFQAMLTEGERKLAGVPDPHRDSIVELRTHWESSKAFRALHPGTQGQYLLALDRLAEHTDFGTMTRVSAISDDLVHRWLDQLEGATIRSNKGGRPSEVRATRSMLATAVAALSSFLTFCTQSHDGRPRVLAHHPLRGTKVYARFPVVLRKDQGQDLTELVSMDTVTRLLDVVDAHPYTALSLHLRVLIYVLLYTGARRGEALGLRWSRVDFTRGVLTMGNSKRKRGHRVLPLWPALAGVLRDYQGMIAPNPDGLIIAHPNGDPLGPGAGYAWLERICADAGVPYTKGFHFARHAYISARVRMLAPEEVIQREVGHSVGSDVTQAAYLHQSERLPLTPVAELDYRQLKLQIDVAREQRDSSNGMGAPRR